MPKRKRDQKALSYVLLGLATCGLIALVSLTLSFALLTDNGFHQWVSATDQNAIAVVPTLAVPPTLATFSE